MKIFSALLLLATATTFAADRAALIQEIKQTERDFCAMVGKEGRKTGFSTYVAIPSMYALDREEYRAKTQEFQPGESGMWQPIFVSVSASGDFGYVWSKTSGTAANTPDGKPGPSGEGLTYTVWRKQTDGTWRFIFDAGSAPAPEVLRAIVASAEQSSAKEARLADSVAATDRTVVSGQLRGTLNKFFAAAKNDGRNAALLQHMTDYALMLDTNVCTKSVATAQLPVGATDIHPDGTLLYLNVSAAGDLAFALSEWAPGVSDGKPTPPRICASVWQRQPDGAWRFTTYHELPARPERLAAMKTRLASLSQN